jgi:hypothetical protein
MTRGTRQFTTARTLDVDVVVDGHVQEIVPEFGFHLVFFTVGFDERDCDGIAIVSGLC